MGGQQGKERHIGVNNTGTITRSGRSKYRSGREIRSMASNPSNVFSEHSGKKTLFFINYYIYFQEYNSLVML